jgi:heme/copper-type cytochrome/quinol oxidase subunit 3
MTFLLISSSATMAVAVGAAKHGDTKTIVRFVLLTVLGGIMFLGCQAYEWSHLIGEGATLHSNPWGAPLFGALCMWIMKRMLYVIAILFNSFMMLQKIIMRGEYMLIHISIISSFPSMC